MDELLQAYANSHVYIGYFIFGYFFISFVMWNWEPPEGTNLKSTTDCRVLDLRFEPWRSLKDTQKSYFNDITFGKWYDTMVGVATIRVMWPLE